MTRVAHQRDRRHARRAAWAAKRCLDVAGAVTGLILLSPVIIATSLAVLLTEGRPILFRQSRPGLHGRPFTLVKFRTMRPLRPGETGPATDRQRITRIGTLLRRTSLDELPELWNVLRGEMSLVGPRPLLVEYLEVYTPEEARRHSVRPGVTGWAAVSGRHTLPFEERLRLDVWYVDHWTIGLDLRIMWDTVRQVVRRSDVEAVQDPTAIDLPDRFREVLSLGPATTPDRARDMTIDSAEVSGAG